MYSPEIIIEGDDVNEITEGEEVTLMDWGNAIIEKIHTDKDGNRALEGKLHLEGSVKNTKKKLTWLPFVDDLLKVNLVEYDYLITKKKLEEEDKLESFIRDPSKYESEALGDPNLKSLKKGDQLQLERRGYFICDEPYYSPSRPIILIMTPDGHTTKAQSTLTTNKDAQTAK